MSSKPYIQFYISDYLGDTSHLSTLEHGAFLLLLMQCWQKGFIPSSDERLARITKLNLEDWLSIKGDLMEFFQPCDGGYYSPRATKELSKIKEKSAKAVTSAKSRWGNQDNAIASEKPMQNEYDSNADAMQTQCDRISERNADAMQTQCDRISERNADAMPYQIPDTIYHIPDPKDHISEDINVDLKVESPSKKNNDVSRIFEYWQVSMLHKDAKLSPKRIKKIKTALSTWGFERCIKAVKGCALSPYHMGENKQGYVYDDLELILRDDKHVDMFCKIFDNPPRAMSKAKSLQEANKKVMDEFLGDEL